MILQWHDGIPQHRWQQQGNEPEEGASYQYNYPDRFGGNSESKHGQRRAESQEGATEKIHDGHCFSVVATQNASMLPRRPSANERTNAKSP